MRPAPRSLFSPCCVLFALGLSLQAAEVGPSIRELTEIALSPVPNSEEGGYPQAQVEAIDKLSTLPKDSAGNEDSIVSALRKIESTTNGLRAKQALRALGSRGHAEFIPEFLARMEAAKGEAEVERVSAFFESLPSSQPIDAAIVEALRNALHSSCSAAQEAGIDLIGRWKITQLRPVLEDRLTRDSVEGVRVRAAITLAKMECRESVGALRSGLRGSPDAQQGIALALAKIGSDDDLPVLLPFLQSQSSDARARFAEAIGTMHLANPKPAFDALAALLADKDQDVVFAASVTLAKHKDSRAIPAIRRILRSKRPPEFQYRDAVIKALETLGNADAIAVLNEMGFSDFDVRKVLLRLAHPSTAYAAWDAYLCDPIKPIPPGSDVGGIYGATDALEMLKTLADEEIFRAIRIRAHNLKEDSEERAELDEVIRALGQRFPKIAAEPIEPLQSKAPSKPSDRDGDGVPDRIDKYPDDPRRSEDIPVAHYESPVDVPLSFYGVIPLAKEGPAAKPPLFMAIDDDNRVGWITQANDTEPPDYHVATSKILEREEWPLPNPGDTPGIYRLVPACVNSRGTVVGTALRKKIAIPFRQSVREAQVTYRSGFIFEGGKLRFDPAPPFTTNSLNVAYQWITNGGMIFGQREMRIREGENEVFRTFSFLGDHVFRDVPAFDVSAVTEAGQLLCFRMDGGKFENFVWDGTRFQDLGSLTNKPQNVRAFALNQRLQVVGLSDAVDKDKCPIGFFWEDGKMKAFPELLPADLRPHLRSAIPYLINDTGTVTFRAEEKAGPFPQFWPKKDYILQLRPDGRHTVSKQIFSGGGR